MTNKECMQGCVKAIQKIKVPVELMDEMGVALLAIRNTLILQIQQIEKEEKNREEEKHADDTVQREEAEPEHD